MGCNGVTTVLKPSPNNEKYGYEKSLDKDTRLKEQSTKKRVCQTKRNGKLSVINACAVTKASYKIFEGMEISTYVVLRFRFTAALALRSNRCDAGM